MYWQVNPFLCESKAGGLSLRVQQLDVRCETKTKDKCIPPNLFGILGLMLPISGI